MTPAAVFDNAFVNLAHDLSVANERDGLTPADSARYDAASAAFDALLRHVYPGLTPLAYDRMREQVVHYYWKASAAFRLTQD